VSQTQVERGAVAVFGVLARGTNGPFRGPWKHLAVQTRLPVAFNWGQAYVASRAGGPYWKFRLTHRDSLMYEVRHRLL